MTTRLVIVVGDHTEFVRIDPVFPPIGTAAFDYSAVTDNYEPGQPIGYGPAPEAALTDLRIELESREP